MGRPANPLLSREAIVSTALALADSEGLEALSTRRLAAELGVAGPSLYNHVGTKDELLDDVVDTVLASVDTSMFAELSAENLQWRAALEKWARTYRDAIAAHPNIVPVLAAGLGRRPNALRIANEVFGGLVSAGWPRREAISVGAVVRYFVLGSALGSFASAFPTDAAVYSNRYPHLDGAHLLATRQQRVDRRAFDTGLRAVLDGLELRYRSLDRR
ncbi:transcriptional regulator [Mycobacterium sp. JS623]|uniref:TetR/AcrR family transcriptional regulator C-terminal domain-containing protein n=1 Tax=Mycobacterium sp. JS623 TaxID=212767 RepID=UPI0002A5667C|nr:TetR/AcrR family transcriptional regulator C-terminal domain-containing protein [Mycobacterium sp. JS623]AGB22067.1 transcriptional regulator [Mycobacterium sp. JS623]